MSFQFYLILYFIIGFLLGNGVPHFVFGAAGKNFRSPFGKKSKPKVNILWGLSNFLIATILSVGLIIFNFYSGYSLIALLVGFWLAIVIFGFQIKEFLSE